MKDKAIQDLSGMRRTNEQWLIAGNVLEARHYLKRAMYQLFATPGANVCTVEYEAAFQLADCIDLLDEELAERSEAYRVAQAGASA